MIKYYFEGHHSYTDCMKKFNIPTLSIINKWGYKYEEYGVEGIIKHFFMRIKEFMVIVELH